MMEYELYSEIEGIVYRAENARIKKIGHLNFLADKNNRLLVARVR